VSEISNVDLLSISSEIAFAKERFGDV